MENVGKIEGICDIKRFQVKIIRFKKIVSYLIFSKWSHITNLQ